MLWNDGTILGQTQSSVQLSSSLQSGDLITTSLTATSSTINTSSTTNTSSTSSTEPSSSSVSNLDQQDSQKGPNTALIAGISVGAVFLVTVFALWIFARRKITSAIKNKEKLKRESSPASSAPNSQRPSSTESSQPFLVPVQMYNANHSDSNNYVSHAPNTRSIIPNPQEGYNQYVAEGGYLGQGQGYNQYITKNRIQQDANALKDPNSSQSDTSGGFGSAQNLGQPMYFANPSSDGSNRGSNALSMNTNPENSNGRASVDGIQLPVRQKFKNQKVDQTTGYYGIRHGILP
ncbi:hypothetical protein HK096_006460, partial [Nowakowskiella sp. JEL0078]